MFASAELAAAIDRAEGRLCAGIVTATAADPSNRSAIVEIGGGVALFAGSGSPTNKMIGVGFDALPPDNAFDPLEALFDARGAILQAEVATLADPVCADNARATRPWRTPGATGRGRAAAVPPPGRGWRP